MNIQSIVIEFVLPQEKLHEKLEIEGVDRPTRKITFTRAHDGKINSLLPPQYLQ